MTAREWLDKIPAGGQFTRKQLEDTVVAAWAAAVAAEREACDVDCAERLGAERLAFAMESEERHQRIMKLQRVAKVAYDYLGDDGYCSYHAALLSRVLNDLHPLDDPRKP